MFRLTRTIRAESRRLMIKVRTRALATFSVCAQRYAVYVNRRSSVRTVYWCAVLIAQDEGKLRDSEWLHPISLQSNHPCPVSLLGTLRSSCRIPERINWVLFVFSFRRFDVIQLLNSAMYINSEVDCVRGELTYVYRQHRNRQKCHGDHVSYVK